MLSYNTSVQTVPTMFIAGIFGFHTEEFFEAEEEARQDVRVSFAPAATPSATPPPSAPPPASNP